MCLYNYAGKGGRVYNKWQVAHYKFINSNIVIMGKKTKIVLIEDDQVLAKVLYNELSHAGFDVSQAFDGEEGLELVKFKRPNLVLLDLVLPKKHGFEVLEELKKSPDTRAIPVIILTLLGEDDDIKKGLRLGADDYIVKSDHPIGEIIEKVRDFFAKESHPQAK